MPVMVRKQLYIEPRQEKMLKRLARSTGKTEAEILREALDRHAEQSQQHRRRAQAWSEIREFIGQRMAKGPLPGAWKWNREEIHDRPRLGRH